MSRLPFQRRWLAKPKRHLISPLAGEIGSVIGSSAVNQMDEHNGLG
ncbi:hypothetical protein X769_18585 [Mesorhizobium sp. LSJC268A00]|nr:hypothetical protein X769_18585 [Mesorhizobium sp. LSJC268A00]ESX30672.1 hypothetical protein X765_09825 [Mesorhizobium sp. LSHC440B00]ESX37713.1 hypothetical protein X763_09610 [Mesorhizobium sp. LSHC432A00]ESX53851.1 hypothetical protein X761_20180 [Mesorhizobium sp. LSHC424B00]ESX74068.1 hypothetical protein X758_09300 [Mesorhizobium sp. LSHC416B00]ESY16468.1 hypothetical protein X750_26490 [Mesorhizobium sp. LNJC394B00]ESY33728.1 hypothetical protein X749_00020 [Mesorhizobium sp. LNJC3